MRANQPMPGVKSRGHARRAPLCYSRPGDGVYQTRIDRESSALIAIYSIMTCAAAVLVVYGAWGM